MAPKDEGESGASVILLGIESKKYKHSGSKRHCAHRNEGHTCKSHRDNFSHFWHRLFKKSEKKKKKDGQFDSSAVFWQ